MAIKFETWKQPKFNCMECEKLSHNQLYLPTGVCISCTIGTYQHKICTNCGLLKNVAEFGIVTIKQKKMLYSICKQCNFEVHQITKKTKNKRIRTRAEIQSRKEGTGNRKIRVRKVLAELKINGCAICGYDKCSKALHFHHINPEDKCSNINRMIPSGYSSEEIVDELNKCILLCSNCHGEIEAKA